MGKLSKLIFGSLLAGAAAAGVYYYLDQTSKESVCDADDPDEVPAAPLDPENVKKAAERAYTTIRRGTQETVTRVRDAFTAKAEELEEEINDTVQDFLEKEETSAPEEAPAEEAAEAEMPEEAEEAEEADEAEAAEEAEEADESEEAEEAEDTEETDTAEEAAPDETEEFFDDREESDN